MIAAAAEFVLALHFACAPAVPLSQHLEQQLAVNS